MEEYKKWLEQQIELCLNDKDLKREHWAFCKAYDKLIMGIEHIVCNHPYEYLSFGEDGYCECEKCNTRLN